MDIYSIITPQLWCAVSLRLLVPVNSTQATISLVISSNRCNCFNVDLGTPVNTKLEQTRPGAKVRFMQTVQAAFYKSHRILRSIVVHVQVWNHRCWSGCGLEFLVLVQDLRLVFTSTCKWYEKQERERRTVGRLRRSTRDDQLRRRHGNDLRF